MNRYLCLDVGNVLGRLDMKPFIKALEFYTGSSEELSYEYLAHIQKVQDLGLYSIRNELKYKFNVDSNVLEALLESWNQILTPDERALNFYANMIDKFGLRVMIVSNVGIEHSKNFDVIFDKHSFFKKAIKHYSCFVGARKPTPVYYHLLNEMYPEFRGAVYVDDMVENLEMGERFGFRTHHLNLSEIAPNSIELERALCSLEFAIT